MTLKSSQIRHNVKKVKTASILDKNYKIFCYIAVPAKSYNGILMNSQQLKFQDCLVNNETGSINFL